MIRSFTPFKPYHYAFSAGGGITAKVLVLDVQSIQVTFSQCVDITAAWGIEVSIAGGDWEIVPSVSGGINKVWTFTTTTEIADDDVVLWQYTGAEDSIVDCVIGNDVGAIGPVTATNPIDLTAPTLVSAEIGTVFDESSDVLVLTFSEPVYSTHPTNGWTLLEGANELTITSASGAGTDTLHFTVTETIYQGQTIIVSYDDEVGDLVDVSGYPDPNVLADITDEAVTNNSETALPFSVLLLESGDNLLIESGDLLLLEVA